MSEIFSFFSLFLSLLLFQLLSFCFDAGPLPEAKARMFFRDVLGAVDYLHRKGIVHRDLKLENCLLDEKERVKLIDFGLASSYLGGTLKTSCGSAGGGGKKKFCFNFFERFFFFIRLCCARIVHVFQILRSSGRCMGHGSDALFDGCRRVSF